MLLEKRIAVPWHVRWKNFRRRLLPVLAFFVVLGITAFLWKRQGQMPETFGRVEAVRVNVASGVDGRLIPLTELSGRKWELLDSVSEGEILARLDDAPLRALLDALRGDMKNFEKEIEAKHAETELEHYDRQHEYLREAAELACVVEKARVDILDRMALIEADRIELQKLDAQIALQKTAKVKGVITAWEIQEAQMGRDLVAKRIEANTAVLSTARETHRLAALRQQRQPAPPEPDVERLLGPIRASITAAEARVREVQVQIDNLEVRAPISGKICAIYYQPGQSVRAQDWILTIGSEESRHIIGYIRPEQRLRPSAGSVVAVRPRVPAADMFDSTVEYVGAQWEPLPLELARDQNMAELVLPVKIKMPRELQLRPGELVDLRFQTSLETTAE